ncbi:MAG TPA: class I SAM-dependent methyltransferase [Actinomycetota bacterium]
MANAARDDRGAVIDFDAMYRGGTPPWDIGRPQGAFLRLAEEGAIRGNVLDVGCGTGEHALLAASLGLVATGIDASPTAIASAQEKARARRLPARFVVGDALDLPALRDVFDTVLDCGLFHVLDEDERARYVESLHAVVVPGGAVHVLCFSDRVPGEVGPARIRREQIRAAFADGWRVAAIDDAAIEATFRPEGVPAWLARLLRV